MASKDGEETTDGPKEKELPSLEVNSSLMEDCFRDACSRGDVDVVTNMVSELTPHELHAMLRSTSSCTGTPLFDAVLLQQVKVVEFLLTLDVDLEQECDINIFYPIFFRDRCTVLCLACASGEVEICRLLLERGASVNHSSLHSSPLIYASEYNNVELMSLLLQHGADANMVPRNLQTEAALLPLYQACLLGHKDTAELLLTSDRVTLDPNKRVCLRGLLGAQCINRHQDYEAGIRFWKQALTELQRLQETSSSAGDDLVGRLHGLYMREASAKADTISGLAYLREFVTTDDMMRPVSVHHGTDGPRRTAGTSPVLGANAEAAGGQDDGGGGNDGGGGAPQQVVAGPGGLLAMGPSHHSSFSDMKLCTTVEELDQLAGDPNALNFQGLLVLESILGPSHPETTQQVSHAARLALENGDLNTACKLFLYIIESNERRNQTVTASEYASQLAHLLLNVFLNFPENLSSIENLPVLLTSALSLLREGALKTYDRLASGSTSTEPTASYFESQVKPHSKVKSLSEIVETFMAFLRILIDQKLTDKQESALRVVISKTLALRGHKAAAKFNIEPELFRIALYGGEASSTLYFYQEDFFPEPRILNYLLECGGDVNCQDSMCADTPLHFCLDCPSPNQHILEVLLQAGAHIDLSNYNGITPYTLMLRNPQLGSPFKYMTLKCLVAQIVAKLGIPFAGHVPRDLESFITLHGPARSPRAHARKSKENPCAMYVSSKNT